MWGASAFRRVGNKLYERGFPIYRPLYAAYKRYADRAEAVDQDGFVSRRCRRGRRRQHWNLLSIFLWLCRSHPRRSCI